MKNAVRTIRTDTSATLARSVRTIPAPALRTPGVATATSEVREETDLPADKVPAAEAGKAEEAAEAGVEAKAETTAKQRPPIS